MESLPPQEKIRHDATPVLASVSSQAPTDLSTNEPTLKLPDNDLVIHHTKNLYPIVRHIILLLFVLISLTLILLLIHQNGKSIYDNGI